MIKAIFFRLVILVFLILAPCYAQDVIWKTISLGATNTLLVKYHVQKLPKYKIYRTPNLPVGETFGVVPEMESRTYSINLLHGDSNVVLQSLTMITFAKDSSSATPEFYFWDWMATDTSVYYVYLYKAQINIVKLIKEGDKYVKAHELAMPYNVNMLEPMIYESPTHAVILLLGAKAYKENSRGLFDEIGLPDSQELLDAKEKQQQRDKALMINH
jgi:hypothetical protein